MRAVILAGGVGKRLRPLTHETPKPLVHIKKKPMINHMVNFLGKYGVTNIKVLTHRDYELDFKKWLSLWKKDLTVKRIGIQFSDKELGEFGEVKYLKKWIGKENFVLANVDNLHDYDLSRVINLHKKANAVATLALVPAPYHHDHGWNSITRGHQIIKLFVHKKNSKSNHIFSGIRILSPEIFKYADFSKGILTVESDILPKVAEDKKLYGIKFKKARWLDCGTLKNWKHAVENW